MIPGVVAEVLLEMIVAHLLVLAGAIVTQTTEVLHDVLMTGKVGDDGGTERMIGTQDHGDVMDQLEDDLKVVLIAMLSSRLLFCTVI